MPVAIQECTDLLQQPDVDEVNRRLYTSLAINNFAVIRNAFDYQGSLGFLNALIGGVSLATIEPELRSGVKVASAVVERLLPGVIGVADALADEIEDERYDFTYQVRSRSSQAPNDSGLHVDNNRVSIKDFLDGELKPGVRVVYQLRGADAEIGVAPSEGGSNVWHKIKHRETLTIGDGWSIPQDRFVGLPLETSSGEVAFAHHPLHYAKNPTNRLILIQDLVLPLGVRIPANYLEADSVASGGPTISTSESGMLRSTRYLSDQYSERMQQIKQAYN